MLFNTSNNSYPGSNQFSQNAGVNTSIVVTTNPRIVVSDSKTVTVGAAKTLVVDILQIDSLFDA